MRPIGEGVWQLDAFPSHAVNAYLVDDILFDCRTRWSAPSILRQLRAHPVSTLAITHAHPDHWGAAGAISAARDIPVVCHEHDADAVAGRAPAAPAGFVVRLGRATCEGPSCRDVRPLRAGETVGDFTVIHTPGHTRGHVVYFRERDGVAVVGDIFNTMHMWTRRVRLGEPPAHLSDSIEENRRSVLKLKELRPRLVLPGHGPPLKDMGRLDEFVSAPHWHAAREATKKPGSAVA